MFCTKILSDKNLPYHDIKFDRITWHDIAKALKIIQNPTIQSFHTFLKNQEMTNNYNITPELIVAAKKSVELEQVFMHYLHSVKDEFWPILGIKYPDYYCITESKSPSRDDFKNYNRFANIYKNILGKEHGYAELIYGADFNQSEFFAGFYIEFNHNQYSDFKNAIESSGMNVTRREQELGTEYRFVVSFGNFMNDELSEVNIPNWFKDCFVQLTKFVDSAPQFKWVICR